MRALFRSILGSGPEFYDLFKSLKKSDEDINEKINKAYQSFRTHLHSSTIYRKI